MISLQFADLKMISKIGLSRCLDKQADGFSRSEAVISILLQRRKHARRVYGTIVLSTSNTDGYKIQGINFPSVDAQRNLMAKLYAKANIDPSKIDYIEAHTTGTQAGDSVEMKAIHDIFCKDKNRDKPLLIGCLKSNMGHAEGASGLCALAKAILIFQTLKIPRNLHFDEVNPNIEGLVNKSMKAVTEITDFNDEVIPLNCFGFGGSNVHLIFRNHKYRLSSDNYKICTPIPRLVIVCGRSEDTLNHLLDHLPRNRDYLTKDFLSLLNNAATYDFMKSRGYLVIHQGESGLNFERGDNHTQHGPKKLYLLFNGLENGLTDYVKQVFNQLNNIEVFAHTIDRLNHYLSKAYPNQMNLKKTLTQSTQVNSLASIVCLASVQIGLVNVLKHLDLTPDGFIGLSLGEILASYANQDIDEREAILYTYLVAKHLTSQKSSNRFTALVDTNHNHRGRSELEAFFKASGLQIISKFGYTYIISGDSNSINKLRKYCKSNHFGIDHLANSNLHIHHPASSNAQVEALIKSIDDVSKVIYQSSSSSKKWIHTSELCLRPIKHISQYIAHYINSNIVLEDVIKTLESNSTVLIVGPSQHLNKYLQKEIQLPLDFVNLFDSESSQEPIDQFLHTLGHLYTHRWNPKVDRLYPVIHPVAIDTPNLSSLIQWDHFKDYKVFKYPDHFNILSVKTYFSFCCNLNASEDWYLAGHQIDGKILFPATGYLMLAWAALCNYWKYAPYQISVRFKNVSILRATVLTNADTKFIVQYIANTGNYIITQGDSKVSVGHIHVCDSEEQEIFDKKEEENRTDVKPQEILTREAIYKELRIRGYDYGDSFQSLYEADVDGLQGKVAWREMTTNLSESSIYSKVYRQNYKFFRNWVSFTDCNLQLALIHNKYARDLFVPVKIESLYCNGPHLQNAVKNAKEALEEPKAKEGEKAKEKGDATIKSEEGKDKTNDKKERHPLLNTYYNPKLQILTSNGLVVQGLKVSMIPRKPVLPTLEACLFVPFTETRSIEEHRIKEVEAYAKQCISLKCKIEGVKDVINMTPEEAKFKFDPNVDKYALLTELKKKLSMIKVEPQPANSKEITYHPNFENDLLIGNGTQTMASDYFIRPLVENSLLHGIYSGNSTINVKVGEVETTNSTLSCYFKHLVDLVSVGSAHLDYYLIHSHLSKVKNHISSKIHKREFNAEDPNFPAEFNEMDVLVARLDGAKNLDLDKFFAAVIRSLKKKGNVVILTRQYNIAKEFVHLLPKSENEIDMNNYVTPDAIIQAAEKAGLLLCCKRIVHEKYLPIYGMLFVPKSDPADEYSVVRVKVDDEYDWIDTLKEELKAGSNKKIWIVSEEPDINGVLGIFKCLGFEPEGNRLRVLSITPGSKTNKIDFNKMPFKEALEKDMKVMAWDDELGWGSYNHVQVFNHPTTQYTKKESKYAYVKSMIPGDLTSLEWVQDDTFSHALSGSVIEVYYAPLNFKDIMHATGRLPLDAHPGGYESVISCGSLLGLEFAGKDKNGNRVMGMIPHKALATKIVVDDSDFLWPVPSQWTLEEACTIPVVYSTAYYALIIRGKLLENESILIHSGSGGVGYAAITICLSMNCKVFTTVGTPEKREFLKKQ